MASVSAPAVAATKSKSSKKSKTAYVKKAPVHPTYLQMSAEAISSLKERSGSSTYAIAKWLEQKYKGLLPDNFKKQLHLQLKKQTQKGRLIQIKNSYKLSDGLKKDVKKDINLNTDPKKSEANALPSRKTSRTTTVLKKVRSVNKLATKSLNSKSTVLTKPLSKVVSVSTKPTPTKKDIKVIKPASTMKNIKVIKSAITKNNVKTTKPASTMKNVKVTKSTITKNNAKITEPASSTKKKPAATKKTSVAKKVITSKPVVKKTKLVNSVSS